MVVGRVGAQCGNVHLTDGAAWVTDNAIYAAAAPRTCFLPYLALTFKSANLNSRSGGSGQPFVNQRILNELVVPVPPVREQRAISDAYDRHLSEVEATSLALDRTKKRAHRTRQAILKRAFEGRLVPQDPSDEPASALLGRIRAEPDASPQQSLDV
jgi:type I restriction enzyme S subunit